MEAKKEEYKETYGKNKNKDGRYTLFNEIKSFYNTKIIFSFLDKKVKFDILKYNKTFQKKFGICLANYKKLSGKYKVEGINGHGEEYTLKKIFWYLKVNIKMEKEMDKEKNMIKMVI